MGGRTDEHETKMRSMKIVFMYETVTPRHWATKIQQISSLEVPRKMGMERVKKLNSWE